MEKNIKIIFVGIIFLCLPAFVSAVSLGRIDKFFVDPVFDLSQREEVSATLQRIGYEAYFYVELEWWEGISQQEKNEIKQAIQDLDNEFHNKIYPALTSAYGSEWKPGIDKDNRITILIHPMLKGAGGYFRSSDEYPRLQVLDSNEREMVYLNADYIADPLIKSFLAHEFTHLITFNQKEKLQGIEEEIWLNEARAEYAPTLVGYDSEYEGSNLERRVKIFLENPFDSITEWLSQEADYGGLNLFIQYIVEQYGEEILSNSMKSKEIGIKSIDIDFSQVFTNWLIAVSVNDCSLGNQYCYQNENLKNLRVAPLINFLPLIGKSTLGVSQTTKNWTGNWFKFLGGKGTLKIKFIGNPENLFKVPYVARSISGEYILNFFELDEYQRGEISVPGFGKEITSVTIIPSIQSKASGFLNPEPSFPFFWEASTIVEVEEVEENSDSKYLEKPISKMTKEEILAKITEIEELLVHLKSQISEPIFVSCQKFEENLFYGLRNDARVECLQEFLKSQGQDIYPQGLVTGNFLSLTKLAVIRFQEKYVEEILAPLGLEKGTGFVGEMTRTKINQLLTEQL